MTTAEKNSIVKEFNSFISYINRNIEPILFKHGELPQAYWKSDVEPTMDKLSSLTKVDDIISNILEIRQCHKDLKDGMKGWKMR